MNKLQEKDGPMLDCIYLRSLELKSAQRVLTSSLFQTISYSGRWQD